MELIQDFLIELLLLLFCTILFFLVEFYLLVISFSLVYYPILLIDLFRNKHTWRIRQSKLYFSLLQLLIPILLLYKIDINLITIVIILFMSITPIIKIRLSYRLYEKGYKIVYILVAFFLSYIILYLLLMYSNIIVVSYDPDVLKLNDKAFFVLAKNLLIITSIMIIPFIPLYFLPQKQVLSTSLDKLVKNRLVIAGISITVSIFLLLVGLITLAFLLLPFIFSSHIDYSVLFLFYIQIIVFLFAISLLRKIYFRKHLVLSEAQNVTNSILYLRSFNQQNVSFWNGKLYKFKNLFNKQKVNLISRLNILPEFLSFEEYFSETIKSLNYRLIALGNPNDRIINKKSITIYSSDETWKDKFKELLKDSKAVLFQVGDTTSIKYELQEILNLNYQSKMFIVTKPKNNHLHFVFLEKFILFLTCRKKASWDKFKYLLLESGFICNSNYFDGAIYSVSDNKIELLRKDCSLPNEYIDEVINYINKPA